MANTVSKMPSICHQAPLRTGYCYLGSFVLWECAAAHAYGPWRSKRPEPDSREGKGKKKSSKEEEEAWCHQQGPRGPTGLHSPRPRATERRATPPVPLFILATFSPSFLLHPLRSTPSLQHKALSPPEAIYSSKHKLASFRERSRTLAHTASSDKSSATTNWFRSQYIGDLIDHRRWV